MNDFEQARQETVRYHEDLYASTDLGEEGTWLSEPHPLLSSALALLPSDRAVVAYDLGAGIGRHAVPMLRRLPDGSQVYAVDLLPSALEQLAAEAPEGVSTVLHTCPADLQDFEFAEPADLVFAFSAIEHLPGPASVRNLLQRSRTAMRSGGVVALGIIADRVEIRRDGTQRPALLESGLSIDTARELLADVYADFTVADVGLRPAEVEEERDGEHYTLASTLFAWLGVAP